ncbi:Cholinesterase [Nymphon striatum]|nr:Cholinesterase [Nymphon striatum]
MLLEAASVGYHLLSPTSENLFNRAAMHSGTPIDTFLFDSKVSTITRAMDLAELVNCNRSDVTLNPKRLQKCLQDVPASLFNDTHVKMKLLQPLTYSFIPTVDDYFISETPNELLKQGKFKKTEVIIGTVKTDGAYFLPIYFPEYFTSGFPTMQQIENMIKRLYPSLSEAQLAGVALKYFGNLSPHHARYATNEAGYMVSDTRFICPTTYFAECMTKFGGKAFYYRFTHQKSGSTDWITVPHGAELAYIFGIAQENNGFTKAEKDLSERLMSQWANFAKTGDPSYKGFTWPVYNNFNRTYYRIYSAKPDTGIGPRSEYCDFWKHFKGIRTPILQYLWVFLSISHHANWMLQTHVFVKTSTGSVKGKLERKNNVILATFLGIPYAKPPVDRRRFARPEAIDLWHGTLNATTYKPDCFQIHGRNGNEVNEDCLYLNIWSPTNGASNLLPVFFYIHGGGFNQGTAHIPGLTFSSRSGCVIVSVSYRLNTFGFLNLYIDEVPGNMGLLDQQMALKWVKKNIEQFGGNSNDITLFGFSAGSASVGYHLLSPTSENLFNRAAMHSGTQIDTFLFDSKVSTITRAMDLAELVNCNRSDVTLNPKRLQKCLQNVPASLFNDTHVKMKLLQPLAHTFKPTVDDYLISETPNELLKQGKFKKAEVIIGTVKTDGAYFLPMYFPEYFTSGFPTMQQIENMIKRLYPSLSEAQLAVVALKYFGNLSPHHARYATNEAGYMFGDTRFICPTTYFAECMTKFGGKAFYYRFTHQKSGSTDWITVPHGAELAYIFGVAQENNGFTKAEKNLSKRLMSQWVNFAKTGFVWPVYNNFNRSYYRIYSAKPDTGIGPRSEYCDFWKDFKGIRTPILKYHAVLHILSKLKCVSFYYSFNINIKHFHLSSTNHLFRLRNTYNLANLQLQLYVTYVLYVLYYYLSHNFGFIACIWGLYISCIRTHPYILYIICEKYLCHFGNSVRYKNRLQLLYNFLIVITPLIIELGDFKNILVVALDELYHSPICSTSPGPTSPILSLNSEVSSLTCRRYDSSLHGIFINVLF